MSDRVNVVEDGITPTPQRRPERPSWIVGVVGFALGLGLGVVVVSPGQDPAVETPVPTTTVVAEATVTTRAEPTPEPGVSDVIEGFPDAIVAIARTPGSSLDHVLWPHKGSVRVRSMTAGEDVVLDTSSNFIAFSDDVPGLEGSLLSMGRMNSIQPVASEVVGYAWHDTEAARLSFTQLAGDSTRLYTVGADLNPTLVAELETPAARVVGWGEWGWVIQRSADEMVLLNPEAEFKDSEAGLAVTTHGSGWVFATEGDETKLVSAGGGVRRIGPALDVGGIRHAAFSPDGRWIAVVGSSGIELLDIETEEVVRLSDFTSTSVTWSSDSRFVVLAAPTGLAVVDLDEPMVGYRVLDPYSALAVGVLPLRSS